jgi:hypothetical protein
MFFAKNVNIKGLRRKNAQEFDSKGLTLKFEVSEGLRRLIDGCGGGSAIHVRGFIAHKCLFVKYLYDVRGGRGCR